MADSLWIPGTLTSVYIALVVFVWTVAAPNMQGIKDARQTWKSRAHVQLVFKAGDKLAFDPVLIFGIKSYHLSLLTQTKDLVIVFEPQSKGVSDESVFVLARSDVASVHTWTRDLLSSRSLYSFQFMSWLLTARSQTQTIFLNTRIPNALNYLPLFLPNRHI